MATVGIWGDSITYGSCDEEALGWVGRLRKSIAPAEDHYNIYNFGVCGDTTEGLLKRFEIECDSIGPDKIIFAIGINDSKYRGGTQEFVVPLEQFDANLKGIVSLAKTKVDEVVLVGPTSVGGVFETLRSTFVDDEILKYNEVIKKVADENSLQFIEMFDVFDPQTELADGVHPTTVGYQKMFERINTELNWN